MKFIRLNKKNEIYFQEMDPFYMLAYAERMGNFAVGVTLTDERGYDVPAGLMIYTKREKHLVLLWLYVKAEYRMQHVAERMLYKAGQIALGLGLDILDAYFNNSPARELVCHGDDIYFREHGFNKLTPLYGEWLTDVRTLADRPYLADATEDKRMLAFSKFPKASQFELATMVLEAAGSKMTEEELIGTLDFDLSFIVTDKDDCGAILAMTNGEIISIICILANGEEQEKQFFKAFVAAAKLKYGQTALVGVILKAPRYEKAMMRLYGEGRADNFVLSIKVTDLLGENYNGQVPVLETDDEPEKETENRHFEEFLLPGKDEVKTLKAIAEKSFFNNIKPQAKIESIGALGMPELRQLFSELMHSGGTGVLREIPKDSDWVDTELSCYIRIDDKPVGFFFAALCEDGSIRPLILYANGVESSRYLLNLLQFAFDEAMKKYPPDTKVYMRLHDETTEKLYNKLIG